MISTQSSFNTFICLLSDCFTFVTHVQLIPICQPVLTTRMKYLMSCFVPSNVCYFEYFNFVTFIQLLPICRAVHTQLCMLIHIMSFYYHMACLISSNIWYVEYFTFVTSLELLSIYQPVLTTTMPELIEILLWFLRAVTKFVPDGWGKREVLFCLWEGV